MLACIPANAIVYSLFDVANVASLPWQAAVILVAQRVSTILDADRILVVDDGRIVGQGTHAELLRTCPLYREIAEIQLGKEAV